MNYWLTIHWPPERRDINAHWRNWIFLAEGFESRGGDITPGDRVVIYETGSSPVSKVGRRMIRRMPGRKGAVAIATVTGAMELGNDEEEVLEDGRVRNWCYHFRTQTDIEGLLELDRLRDALERLGFSARTHGGLMRISRRQFERIEEMFSVDH